MSKAEEIRQASVDHTAPAFLKILLEERFPHKTAVTVSLRARSIVVLSMVAEIDAAARIIFCHAPDLYPESTEYRDRIIEQLKLTDVRIADHREPAAPADTVPYVEDIWADVWGGGREHSVQHLNRLLDGFNCWISAVYHRPYGDLGIARVADEGDLIRVDLLHGWTQEHVYAYMAEHDLSPHPHIELKEPRPSLVGSAVVTYHY